MTYDKPIKLKIVSDDEQSSFMKLEVYVKYDKSREDVAKEKIEIA